MLKKNYMVSIFLSFLLSGILHAKTLNVAFDSDPVSMDPHEQLSSGTIQLSHLIFDPLVRWNKDYSLAPRLATKWERIDELTVRFYLRKNVVFHSGNPFTAKDVQWTLKRLINSQDFKGIFSVFDKSKIIDDYTIDLITKKPYPLILNVATYLFPMDSQFYSGKDDKGQNKDAIVKNGESFASRNASGTGPFVITERQQGVKTIYQRFSNYWNKSNSGNIDKIVLTPIKESATRVASLLSGDVDFIFPVPPSDHKQVKKSAKTKLVTLAGTRIITLQLNQKRVKAFQDKRVRQAIAYAVNNKAIVKKIMKGFATVASQESPKGYIGHVDELKPRYNLRKAKKLMKEAGYGKGFSITMTTPNNRYVNDARIAQAVASMLSKIKIKVDLKTIPKAQYWVDFDARAADIMMVGWRSDTEDSANFTQYLTACPNKETGWGQYNSGSYCNPKVDELVAESNVENNETKRTALLQSVERILYNDAAFIPLHWQNLAWGVAKGVKAENVVNTMDYVYFGDLVAK